MPSVFMPKAPWGSFHFPEESFIYSTGGVTMCRKSHLHGCCLLAFGLGLMVGHCLESWFFCCFGGFVLIILGFCVMRKKR